MSIHCVTAESLNVDQSHMLCRPVGKSIEHLIGFLDTGYKLSFLPAEMGFTWQSWKHFLLAGPWLMAHFVKAQQLH